MDLTIKQRILIELFILTVLCGLSLAIYFHGQGLSCDKCVIKFKQDRKAGMALEDPIIYIVKPGELYSGLINNSCPITWGRTNGYFYSNGTIR